MYSFEEEVRLTACWSARLISCIPDMPGQTPAEYKLNSSLVNSINMQWRVYYETLFLRCGGFNQDEILEGRSVRLEIWHMCESRGCVSVADGDGIMFFTDWGDDNRTLNPLTQTHKHTNSAHFHVNKTIYSQSERGTVCRKNTYKPCFLLMSCYCRERPPRGRDIYARI